MSKKAVIIIAVIIVLAIGGVAFYNGYLYKSARDISSEEAVFTVPAGQLAADYKKDAAAADTKYLNKTIEVTGNVTGIADSVVTIDSAVVCGFDRLPANNAPGKPATVKGRCIGYDELFGEVKLDQCTIRNKYN